MATGVDYKQYGNYVEDEYNNIKFRYRFGGKYKHIAFDFHKYKFNKDEY